MGVGERKVDKGSGKCEGEGGKWEKCESEGSEGWRSGEKERKWESRNKKLEGRENEEGQQEKKREREAEAGVRK